MFELPPSSFGNRHSILLSWLNNDEKVIESTEIETMGNNLEDHPRYRSIVRITPHGAFKTCIFRPFGKQVDGKLTINTITNHLRPSRDDPPGRCNL